MRRWIGRKGRDSFEDCLDVLVWMRMAKEILKDEPFAFFWDMSSGKKFLSFRDWLSYVEDQP